jgi:hypothetical protein
MQLVTCEPAAYRRPRNLQLRQKVAFCLHFFITVFYVTMYVNPIKHEDHLNNI